VAIAARLTSLLFMSTHTAAKSNASQMSASNVVGVETKDELITRLLAKADLAYKCCGFAPPGKR